MRDAFDDGPPEDERPPTRWEIAKRIFVGAIALLLTAIIILYTFL